MSYVNNIIKGKIDSEWWTQLMEVFKEDKEIELALQTKKVHKDHGLVFHEGWVCVPQDTILRTVLLAKCYDSTIARHVGAEKTLEVLQ